MKYFIEAVLIPMCFVLLFYVPTLIGQIIHNKRQKEYCESNFNKSFMRRGFIFATIFAAIATAMILYFAYFD